MIEAPEPPLLSVENLCVTFATRRGPVEAVRGIDFTLSRGRMLGIVGESGSGKSVTAFAISRLLDPAGRISGGRIRFRGEDITRHSQRRMRALRGTAISMIYQNPRAALNPIRTAGRQISDALRAHRPLTPAAARERALDLLATVRIRDPEKRLDAYPHELSGGMCQRVMIAIAIACEPALLIADEPATGLDVTTQKAVMDLIARIAAERHMAVILITHDLGLAAEYCQDVAVMERGRIVERAAPPKLFYRPDHAYTRRLVAASLTPSSRVEDLVVEDAIALPPPKPKPKQPPGTPLLLEVQNLVKIYREELAAVGGVSFSIARGESVGLVGESGSGKSTISRLICRLIDQTQGDILFDGESIGTIPAREFHYSPIRRQVQIVFQDPHDSLNPRFTAFQSIAHPLHRLTSLSRPALRERVYECALKVGLPFDLLDRFPHQLSGGQKARVGIARAISVSPRLLVLDEPTAALDVSVQAVTLQLLERLRREEDLGFLFVSHDLNVVRMMCERTIVLRNGQVVEQGRSDKIFDAPEAEYTRALIAAIPRPLPV